MLREQYGDHAATLLAAYEPEVGKSSKWGAQAIQADRSFVWEMRTWARTVETAGNDAYLYFFSQAPPLFRIYVPERAAHRHARRPQRLWCVSLGRSGLCLRQPRASWGSAGRSGITRSRVR